jgi:acyl-coenzyme A thioesterase 13
MCETKKQRKKLALGKQNQRNNTIYNGTPEEKINAWLQVIGDSSQGKDWMNDLVPHIRVHSICPTGQQPSVSFLFTVQSGHCNNMQTLHGGCTATLFDICTTLPLAFVAGPGFWRMLGVSRTLTVSYLAPVFVGASSTKGGLLVLLQVLRVLKMAE